MVIPPIDEIANFLLGCAEDSVCEEWLDHRKNTSASEVDTTKEDYQTSGKQAPLMPDAPTESILTTNTFKSTSNKKRVSRKRLRSESPSSSSEQESPISSREHSPIQTSSRKQALSPSIATFDFRQEQSSSRLSQEPRTSSTPCRSNSSYDSNTLNHSKKSAAKLANLHFPMEEGRFQKEVIQMLLRIQDSVKNGGSSRQAKENNDEVYLIKQAESIDEFNDLENSLGDKETYKKLLSRLKTVGGKSLYSNVLSVMEMILSNGVMAKFNMEGKEKKNGKGKMGFEKKKIFNLVIESVRATQPKFTDDDIKKKVADVLKYAPDRPGGGGRGNKDTA